MAKWSDRRTSLVRGEPTRFLKGHSQRVNPKPVLDRFWSKVQQGLGPDDCWRWSGSTHNLGYGQVGRVLGETKAHRLAYRLFVGPIPRGKHVLHRCDVRNCVNPAHLFIGTHADNMADMCRKGRGRPPRLLGETNPMARLTSAQVAEIRAIVREGSTQRAAAAHFRVSPMTISRIITGQTWKDIS